MHTSHVFYNFGSQLGSKGGGVHVTLSVFFELWVVKLFKVLLKTAQPVIEGVRDPCLLDAEHFQNHMFT